MTTGTFTITPDSTTTAFTTSIHSGNSRAISAVATDYDTTRDGWDIAILSSQVSGTTLTVNIWQRNSTGGLAPLDTSVGNIDITYFVS